MSTDWRICPPALREAAPALRCSRSPSRGRTPLARRSTTRSFDSGETAIAPSDAQLGQIVSNDSIFCSIGQLTERVVRGGVQRRGGQQRQWWRWVLSDDSCCPFVSQPSDRLLGPTRVCLAERYRRFGSFSCGWRVVRPRMFPAPFTMKATRRTRLNGQVS